MSDESQYIDEAGNVLAFEQLLDTGEVGLIDAQTGEVVSVSDPETGEVTELEPGSFYVETEAEPAYDARYDQLEQRYDQLEQRLNEPITHRHEYVQAEPQEQDVHDTWHRERRILESPGALGRPVTDKEFVELATAAAADGHFSLLQAAEDASYRGAPLRDIDATHPGRAHQARSELAAELLSERNGLSGDPITGQVERQHEQYDSSTHAGRVAMAQDRLAGHDIEGRDTSSPSYPTTEDWQDDDAF